MHEQYIKELTQDIATIKGQIKRVKDNSDKELRILEARLKEKESRNVYITIGNKNKIKNLKIQVDA